MRQDIPQRWSLARGHPTWPTHSVEMSPEPVALAMLGVASSVVTVLESGNIRWMSLYTTYQRNMNEKHGMKQAERPFTPKWLWGCLQLDDAGGTTCMTGGIKTAKKFPAVCSSFVLNLSCYGKLFTSLGHVYHAP